MKPINIFISSVQSEFAKERRILADYLRNDAMFRKICEVFIFEDIPAQDRLAHDLYITEVKKCDIYIGLLEGNSDLSLRMKPPLPNENLIVLR